MGTPDAAHTRVHTSLTASLERRVLIRLAGAMPDAVTSDHLSLLGLAAMGAAGLAFAAFRWTPWAAAGVAAALALNWFGDSLDGTLARVRQQQRPRYGYYVDHVIDLAGTTALLAGLAGSGLMQPLVACAVLAAYLLGAIDRVFGMTMDYLKTREQFGRKIGSFSGAHALACPSEHLIYVAESSNWRVQKFVLHPGATAK